MARLAFGFMTGTSCDGLDAAAVRVTGAGLEMRCQVVGALSLGFGPLAAPVGQFARGGALAPAEIARLALDLAELHAEGVRRLRQQAGGGGQPDLVAVHGQTVFHDPPASWQLVNPWPIAREAACPVLTDLRGADLAAEGQGAPITPIADWLLFCDRPQGAGERQTRAVVNLGGFCNITLLPSGSPGRRGGRGSPLLGGGPPPAIKQIQARDVCACNHVLDAAARAVLGEAFDADGAAAARGSADQKLAAELEARLRAQAKAGRSLGSADELVGEVERMLNPASGLQGRQDAILPHSAKREADLSNSAMQDEGLPHSLGRSKRLAPDDAMATVTAAVAGAIASEINGLTPAPDAILIAGGSVRNQTLIAELAERCRAPVANTAEFGVDPQYREAAAMAIVGCLAHDGAPVALPHVTGAREPILWTGSWTNLPPARIG